MGDIFGLASGWIRDCDDLLNVYQIIQLKTMFEKVPGLSSRNSSMCLKPLYDASQAKSWAGGV
jgi:hypothetical protein